MLPSKVRNVSEMDDTHGRLTRLSEQVDEPQSSSVALQTNVGSTLGRDRSRMLWLRARMRTLVLRCCVCHGLVNGRLSGFGK